MWFLVGFVSETIIAKELLEACRDVLVSTVQEMLRDHLADEARHSRYFCEVFHYFWQNFSDVQRAVAAKLLIEILLIFFETDECWLSGSLRSVGLSEKLVAQIIAYMADEDARLLRIRASASATFQALKEAGFFDLSTNKQLFSEAGLIDE